MHPHAVHTNRLAHVAVTSVFSVGAESKGTETVNVCWVMPFYTSISIILNRGTFLTIYVLQFVDRPLVDH